MSNDFLKILNAFNNTPPPVVPPKIQPESYTTREERIERSKNPDYNKPIEEPSVEEVIEEPPVEEIIEEPSVEEVIEEPSVEEIIEKEKTIEPPVVKNEVKLPKISVVMQVYLGDYPGSRVDSVFKFHRAVKSFLDQDYKKSELIIVSDGCDIVHKEYYERYANLQNIKYAFVDKTGLMNMYQNIGENKYYRGVPRQVGRGLASGDLITYMDSDDYLHPKFIYQIVYNYNMAPDDAVWFVNNTWYDHVNILSQPISNLLEDYGTSKVINIPMLNAKFVETKVKAGLIVNTPWLLTHKAEAKTRWKDTLGAVSEDVEFGRALRDDYKGLGYQFSAPTYIRCHYTGLWDI